MNPIVNPLMNPMNMLVTSAESGCSCNGPRRHKVPGMPINGNGYIDLFEHIDFGGCEWHIPESFHNGTVPNYGDLWCGILWLAKNANNRVSSMDILVSAGLVWFFDLENLNLPGGSATILMPGDAWVPNLVDFGWNDRISSHILLYTQP